MDTLLLSRIQFAVTIGFHYIYPPLSIGLGIILVVMEGLYLKTRDPHYLKMAKFWVKVFGLTFSLGVAVTTVALFAMHGSIYVVMKTEGEMHGRIRTWINKCIIFFIICYATTTMVTLLFVPHMTALFKEYRFRYRRRYPKQIGQFKN